MDTDDSECVLECHREMIERGDLLEYKVAMAFSVDIESSASMPGYGLSCTFKASELYDIGVR